MDTIKCLQGLGEGFFIALAGGLGISPGIGLAYQHVGSPLLFFGVIAAIVSLFIHTCWDINCMDQYYYVYLDGNDYPTRIIAH